MGRSKQAPLYCLSKIKMCDEPFPPQYDSIELSSPYFLIMMKSFFSILVGTLFAIATLLLVGIYWLFSLLARMMALLLLPFHKLLSKA